KLADFRIQHFLDIEGIIDYRGVMYARNNFTVTTGYPLMLPVNKETLNRVVTSYGNSKLNSGDNSEYFFSEENGESKSVVFTTDISGYGSYVAFATLDEATKTMMYYEEGSPPSEESLFFWQRENIPKFYFQSMKEKDFTPNETYRWGGKIGIGKHVGIANYL